MKPLFSMLLLMLGYSSFAQNYQCLQYGVKHFFTNSNGYLRGIRIDSVRASGADTVYYPYHTPRGYYNALGGPTVLDSTRGSWLGGKVIKQAEGTWLFDNLWHDTVMIKSQASVGDTWIFYNDTTSLYYLATLTSTDTMTVLGVPDSIKSITITAHNSSGVVTTDPVNNFQLILSKNSGFVQVFDLYTFPYHSPDSAYREGIDYYLSYIINAASVSIATTANSYFFISNFSNPTQGDLYQWNTGDVYEYGICSGSPGNGGAWGGCLCEPYYEYDMDSVISITSIAGAVNYHLSGWKADLNVSGITPLGYTTTANTGLLNCSTTTFIPGEIMPEEYLGNESGVQLAYYYKPSDSSYCIISPTYEHVTTNISHSRYVPPFEQAPTYSIYKAPLGLILSHGCSLDGTGIDPYIVDETRLLYYSRSGTSCNTPTSLAAANVTMAGNNITLSPNPVATQLTIATTNYPINEIVITNLLGQQVYNGKYSADKIQLDVAALPAGMYMVKINGLVVHKLVKE